METPQRATYLHPSTAGMYSKKIQGDRTPPPVSELIENPELRLSGVYAKPRSDLQVSCQVFCDGVPLALPTRTSYKSFHDTSVWDGECPRVFLNRVDLWVMSRVTPTLHGAIMLERKCLTLVSSQLTFRMD